MLYFLIIRVINKSIVRFVGCVLFLSSVWSARKYYMAKWSFNASVAMFATVTVYYTLYIVFYLIFVFFSDFNLAKGIGFKFFVFSTLYLSNDDSRNIYMYIDLEFILFLQKTNEKINLNFQSLIANKLIQKYLCNWLG